MCFLTCDKKASLCVNTGRLTKFITLILTFLHRYWQPHLNMFANPLYGAFDNAFLTAGARPLTAKLKDCFKVSI